MQSHTHTSFLQGSYSTTPLGIKKKVHTPFFWRRLLTSLPTRCTRILWVIWQLEAVSPLIGSLFLTHVQAPRSSCLNNWHRGPQQGEGCAAALSPQGFANNQDRRHGQYGQRQQGMGHPAQPPPALLPNTLCRRKHNFQFVLGYEKAEIKNTVIKKKSRMGKGELLPPPEG